MPFLEASGVWMTYPQPGEAVTALRDVTVGYERGELAVITGESGSGKSTLLSLLAGLDRPTRGSIRLDGESLDDAGQARLAAVRRDRIGLVFQDFRLVRHLTALENVELPLLFSGRGDRRGAARERLEGMGLGRRLHHRPGDLSRGEMQRVAIARALVNEPDVLLADEPTANLDRRNGEVVRGIFHELHEGGLTVVVATHDPGLLGAVTRVTRLRDGEVVSHES